jgi:hypothetical protein
MQSLPFVVITGVKHLRGRRVEPAGGRGLQAIFWGDCETAEAHIENLQTAVWRRPCLYSVVAGRRVVGDVELNTPSEPEYSL